jgi:hypothetical protein
MKLGMVEIAISSQAVRNSVHPHLKTAQLSKLCHSNKKFTDLLKKAASHVILELKLKKTVIKIQCHLAPTVAVLLLAGDYRIRQCQHVKVTFCL